MDANYLGSLFWSFLGNSNLNATYLFEKSATKVALYVFPVFLEIRFSNSTFPLVNICLANVLVNFLSIDSNSLLF